MVFIIMLLKYFILLMLIVNGLNTYQPFERFGTSKPQSLNNMLANLSTLFLAFVNCVHKMYTPIKT